MSLYQNFTANGPSGFGYGSTAEQVTAGLSLAGQTILVTGCNSGSARRPCGCSPCAAPGSSARRAPAKRRRPPATPCRAPPSPSPASSPTPPASAPASPPSRTRASSSYAIVCNAGIMALPRLELVHGYEKQFFTNHIGHFMLVTGLLGQLTATGRVVMLSSSAHRRVPKAGIAFDNLDGARGYQDFVNCGQSKLANLLFAKELARRFAGTGRTANAVHPGVIATNLARSMSPILVAIFRMTRPLFLKNVPQGAATQVYVATHPTLAGLASTTAWVAMQDVGNTTLLIALAATLPRQIEMTLDMHQLTAVLTDMIAVWTRIEGVCEHIEPVADAGFVDRIGFGRLELKDGTQERVCSSLADAVHYVLAAPTGLVSLHGGNGAGKSTLLAALKNHRAARPTTGQPTIAWHSSSTAAPRPPLSRRPPRRMTMATRRSPRGPR